jgi:hypothetical protein
MPFAKTQQLNAARYFSMTPTPAEPPPSLQAALDSLRRTQIPLVFAEIKHDAAFGPETEARYVINVVRGSGIQDRVVITSSTPQVLVALRELDSTARLGYVQDVFQSSQVDFVSEHRIEFLLLSLDFLLYGDPTGPTQLRNDGVRVVGYTAISVAELVSTSVLPSGTLVLADTVPAFFGSPLSPQGQSPLTP